MGKRTNRIRFAEKNVNHPFCLKKNRVHSKALLIITLALAVGCLASTALAQDFMYQYHQYKHSSWQAIWAEEPAVESTVGGDAWKVNGKWVTGHFNRNGDWARPGYRAQMPGWYGPGYGTSWYERHTHGVQSTGWMGCR